MDCIQARVEVCTLVLVVEHIQDLVVVYTQARAEVCTLVLVEGCIQVLVVDCTQVPEADCTQAPEVDCTQDLGVGYIPARVEDYIPGLIIIHTLVIGRQESNCYKP